MDKTLVCEIATGGNFRKIVIVDRTVDRTVDDMVYPVTSLVITFPPEKNLMRTLLVPNARETVYITVSKDMDTVLFSLARWKGGALVQDAFPYLDADQRELLMTGLTFDDDDSDNS